MYICLYALDRKLPRGSSAAEDGAMGYGQVQQLASLGRQGVWHDAVCRVLLRRQVHM